MKEKKEKGFILSSIENFWYYYKWPFLGGIVIFFAVLLFLTYMTDTTEPSDAKVVTVFARPLTMQELNFNEKLNDVISDIDENGKTVIETQSFYITEQASSEGDTVEIAKFENVLAYADCDLVILDGANFDRYAKKDFLEPLDKYVDLSKFESENIRYRDGKPVAVRLDDSKVLLDMDFIIDDVYAGIMFVPDETPEVYAPRRENAANMLQKLTQK